MDDERLAKIEQEKQNAINQSNNMYNSLLQDNQNLYNVQNEYANTYEQTQNDILDKQLAYNTNLIEKQKEIARENKAVEEKKAKNDYTQFINPYGYRNENLAERGLLKSGVSETSMLGGFNAYQNRLATANKVMQDAFVQYDNDINQARLNNDVQKAQNALNKLQMQLEFSQNFYNNKSTISQNQLSNNQNLDNEYNNRYQTEYNNIQSEKERAEQIRQWQESFNFQKQQAAQDQANWEKEYALSKQKSSSSSKKSGNSTNNISLTDGSNNELTNSNEVVNRRASVKLSSSAANKFSAGLKTSYSISELKNQLTDAYNRKIINDDDLKLILWSYNLS